MGDISPSPDDCRRLSHPHTRPRFSPAPVRPRRGPAQADARSIPGAAVAAHNGRIVLHRFREPASPRSHADAGRDDRRRGRRRCRPRFVDAHTHVIFAGDRRERASPAADRRQLRRDRRRRRRHPEHRPRDAQRRASRCSPPTRACASAEMLRCGTTTAEAKSGYGLTTDVRAEDAARDPRAWRNAADRALARPSWARTRCRSSIRTRRRAYVD